jgi:hypothetical protein
MEIRYIPGKSKEPNGAKAKADAAFRRERTTHERVRREAVEMKLAERRGELISRKLAGEQIGNLLTALKQRLLLLPEVLPRVLEGKNPHEMRAILVETIHDALRELSRLPSTLSEARRDAVDGRKAKPPRGKRGK